MSNRNSDNIIAQIVQRWNMMEKKNPYLKDLDGMSLKEIVAERNHLKGMGDYIKAVGGPFPGQPHSKKYLYFIRCEDAIKVGVSNNPYGRMKTLQTGAPGKLILKCQIPNAGHRENECHKRLAHLHLYGEWYRYTSDIDILIKSIQDEMEQQ